MAAQTMPLVDKFITGSDSNSISSVKLRWLPRSLLAVQAHCLRRSLVAALFDLRNRNGIIG
jgi:hypothetical protein